MKKSYFVFRTTLLTILCSLPMLASTTSQAQGTNVFFTSSEQRERLDQLRSDYLAETEAKNFDIIDVIAKEVPVEEVETDKSTIAFHLAAIMTPKNKERTVWLNNRYYYESELPTNTNIIDFENGLALLIKAGNADFILKAGQILNTQTGAIEESSLVNSLEPDTNENNPQDTDNKVENITNLDTSSDLLSEENKALPVTLSEEDLIPSIQNIILENLDSSKLIDPAVIQALQVLQEAMND